MGSLHYLLPYTPPPRRDTSDREDDRYIIHLTVSELKRLLKEAAKEGAQEALASRASEWLTTQAAAEQYGIGSGTINAAIREGRFVPESPALGGGGRGKTHRFKRSTFESWLSRR